MFDVVLALALLVAKLTTLATGVQSGPTLAYVLAPAWTLPLVWRRSHPAAVALVVVATDVVEVAGSGYRNSVVALLVLLIVLFSLGAHAESVRGIAVGLAAIVVGTVVAEVAQSHPSSATGWLSHVAGLAAVIVVPFAMGHALRQQRLRADAMERLAVELEREREERARTAVAEERARIARELHDEVAHAMSVIAVQADAAEGALARDPALVESPLVAIRETARGALADMRRVLGALRPLEGDAAEQAERAPDPGLARLGALLEQSRRGGLEVDLRVEGEPQPLPPALDLAAYRVLQEGLTNVRKHAGARRVEVVLRYGGDEVGVEVADDGDGSGSGGGSGRGLAGVRERVALLGGEFVAGPRSRGFALRVTLPLA